MRIEKLRQNYDIDIKLVHFPLHPDTPPEGREMAGFYAERGLDPDKMYQDMKQRMDAEGLPYGKRTHSYNSRLAQELGKWSETVEGGEKLEQEFYKAYFVNSRNIGDVLGVIAGSGELPIPVDNFRKSIRESGVAVESNLKGFELGLAYMSGELKLPNAVPEKKIPKARPSAESLITDVLATYPAEAQAIVSEGVKRLVDYQNPAYAKLYLDRLSEILTIDRERGGERNGWALTVETGRYLALMMSYEDIIRVADLKSRRSRMERVRADVLAKPDEPIHVTEFLKPGFDEMTSVMPSWLGRPIMNWARGKEWANNYNFAMRVRTDTINGFMRLWTLSKLRFYRPKTYRYQEEQKAIEGWLNTVRSAAALHYQLAVEVAELANLRKGYSDTHKRGLQNFTRIMDKVGVPCSTAAKDPAWGVNALSKLRAAALADPEGDALEKAFSELDAAPQAAAAE